MTRPGSMSDTVAIDIPHPALPDAPRILVSACLLGNPVRYDGTDKLLGNSRLQALQAAGRVLGLCPEVAGGLPVPRPAAEIHDGNGNDVIDGSASVRTRDGTDVTEAFIGGARQALETCRRFGIEVAILTERSPSCGSNQIHDGSFSGSLLKASGVTTALLRRHGIRVYSQHQVDAALDDLETVSQQDTSSENR